MCRRCTDLALLSLAHHFSSFYLSFSPQIHVLSSDQPILAFRWDRGESTIHLQLLRCSWNLGPCRQDQDKQIENASGVAARWALDWVRGEKEGIREVTVCTAIMTFGQWGAYK